MSNLLIYTDLFDDASWTKLGSSVTANVTAAPGGAITADKVVEDSGFGPHYVAQSVSLAPSETYAESIYAKAAERSWLLVWFVDRATASRGVYFDVSTGALGTVFGSATGAIIAAGDGWFRCSISAGSGTGANDPSSIRYQVVTADGEGAYSGDGSSGLYLSAAQFELGALTAYEAGAQPLRPGTSASGMPIFG